MDSKPLDQFSFSPFVELFGTFFEKLTNHHPYKESLRKELAEFKCILYTNQKDAGNIDAYLNSVANKSVIPLQNLSGTAGTANPDEPRKANTNNNGSSNKPSFNFIKKVEILLISDFLKYRSVGRADKKQTLTSRYSHVQSLEKNPNNFYKTLATYIFTLIMKSSGSDRKLSEMVDEIAAKRIELACPAENLTHEDMCGVFCGYFSQLIRMKRVQQPTIKILETFHDMVGSDKIFGTGLTSFIKSKIYAFVGQEKFPYELIGIKAHVQSKAFKEKVENNDNSELDNVLRLIPFIFQKDVVVHMFENGTLLDITYKAPKAKDPKDGQIAVNDNNDPNTIYLLIEKVFLTVTVFGLFTGSSSPFLPQTKIPVKSTVSLNTVPSTQPLSSRPSLTGAPYVPTKIEYKIPKLQLDAMGSNGQNSSYQMPSITSPSNRESLREFDYSKYRTKTERRSSNSSGIGTINFERKSYLPYNYGTSYTNIDPSKQEIRSDALSSIQQDASTRNSYMSVNLNNASGKSINSSLTERSYQINPENRSYYLRNTHTKTGSYGYYNLTREQPTTLAVRSERNSLNSEHYQYTKALEVSKGQSQNKYLGQTASYTYSQRSSYGSSTKYTYTPTKQYTSPSYQAIAPKTLPVTVEKTNSNSTADANRSQGSESNNSSPTYQNSSPAIEKLKNIVSNSPKSLTQLAGSTSSLSNNNYTAYPRPTYSYSSKYATSVRSKYEASVSAVKPDSDNQTKPENKYQLSSNYSYQRRPSGAVTDRNSYTQPTETSQNGSLVNEHSSYRPYTYHNPSAFRNDSIREISKNAKAEKSQDAHGVQLATLSTNTSINNNIQGLVNQVTQTQV